MNLVWKVCYTMNMTLIIQEKNGGGVINYFLRLTIAMDLIMQNALFYIYRTETYKMAICVINKC